MKRKKRTWLWAGHQKRWFGKWHTYLGIIAGLVVSFIAATGSILVFQDEIDQALNPKLYHTLTETPKLGFSEVVKLVKEQYPKQRITSISIAEKENVCAAYKVISSKGKRGTATETFINPYTGALSGKRIYSSSFIKIVTDLHVNLMLSLPGKIIVGLSTLILLILTISGLRLWIPSKWKRLKSVLTVKFSSGWKRQNYDWHNTIGFYTAPFVIVLCATGFCMNLGILGAPVLMKVGGEDIGIIKKLIGTKSMYRKGLSQLPINDILTAAKKEMPDAHAMSLLFPADSTGTFALQMLGKSKIGQAKRDVLLIDQYSGTILFNNRKELQQIGKAYLGWLQPLHYGNFGGMPTKILAVAGGLSPLVLTFTGFIIWWPRYKKQKRKKRHKVPLKSLDKAAPDQITLVKTYRQILLKGCRQGSIYALWIVLISLFSGALYGLPSGVIVEPAFFTFYLITSIVLLNFAVALIVIIAALLARSLVIFRVKVNVYGAVRYFALSFSFSLVCIAVFILSYRLGITAF